jgi:EmrB/QacA subfamily drug resistance transporter
VSGAAADAARGIRYSRRRWGVLAILCVGVFMLLLDGTIVNIAIPDIMSSFDTSFSAVEWVMNAYLLVFAVLLITTGRFGDLYGRKLLFVMGVTLFTLSSLACGLAPGIGWLIGFRAVQGLGGAMMMPNTLSIVSNVFPPEERGKAMGFWGGVSGISLALGPSLGGLLVDASSWRWIFFINVPIGVILLVLALRYVPESTDPTSVKQIDYAGVGLLTASMFCLTFALIEGQNYGWTSGLIVGLFAATIIGMTFFVLVQRRQRQPLMELGLFKNRTYTVTNLVALLMSFGMMGIFFLLPVFLQAILGYSAIKAGLVMTPLAAVVIVAAPTSGALSDRIGPKWLMFTGMLVTALGFYLTRRVMVTDGSWPSLVAPFVVTGLGIGMVMPPMTSAVMGSVGPEKAGQASGVISSFRQIGSVLGIAVMGAVLQNRAVAYIKSGVAAKLDASPFPIPAAAKQAIVDAVGSSAVNMGQIRAGGGLGAAIGGAMGGSAGGSGGSTAAGVAGAIPLPDSVAHVLSQLPESVAKKVVDFFIDLFNLDFLVDKFAHGMRTAYFCAIILMVVGAVLTLAVSGRVKNQRATRPSGSESDPPVA